MKKTLSIILAILMIVTTVPFAFAADIVNSGTFVRSNVEWAVDSDNVLTISGEGSMGTLAGYAFNSSIKSRVNEVIIEEGVTDIYSSLFNGWSNLTSVYIADSVETIGAEAFRNCSALTRICIGSGVQEIGYRAFETFSRKVIHYNGTENMWNNITKDMIDIQSPDLHYLEKISKPATCSEDGQEDLVCTKCDDTFSSKVIPASHKLVAVEAKAKTCTEAGWDAYEYCTECDYSTKVEILASHELVAVDAQSKTCTEAGWEAYEYCTECDYSTKVEIPASHDIAAAEAKAPTCTETGWDAYEYCTACDYSTKVELPAVDHVDADADGKCDIGGENITCPDCGRPVHEGTINQFICIILTFIRLIVSFFKSV